MTSFGKFGAALFVGALTCVGPVPAQAAAPESCKDVHLATVGWTDIEATTGVATVLLDAMGYTPKTTMYSVPVTFVGLNNGDVDAFLGLWMPSMKGMIQPYLDKDAIDRVAANLEGAKYTLAVPTYAYDAGVKSVADLDAHKDQFDGTIYGIEPGNDGNLLIQSMIDQDAFGLGDWTMMESSEAGMVMEATKASRREDWIVFLGWAPHPMNTKMDMKYLSGADDYFGPEKGGATVYTLTRHGYASDCPNLGRFFQQLSFTLEMENTLMADIMDSNAAAQDAATTYLRAHPTPLQSWLDGVTTAEGKPALPAVKAALGLD